MLKALCVYDIAFECKSRGCFVHTLNALNVRPSATVRRTTLLRWYNGHEWLLIEFELWAALQHVARAHSHGTKDP